MRRRRVSARASRKSSRREFHDAATEAGQDELYLMFFEAKTDFHNLLVLSVAVMADSMDPQQRSIGRTILGIEKGFFPDEIEVRVANSRKAMVLDDKAIYTLAREAIGDEHSSAKIKKAALSLVAVYSTVLLKTHIVDPKKGPSEKELLETIENLDQARALAIMDDLQIISRSSPYESVKRAARQILSQLD